jgi:hypothetical protein
VGVLGNPLHFEIDRDLSPHSVQNIQPVIKRAGIKKKKKQSFLGNNSKCNIDSDGILIFSITLQSTATVDVSCIHDIVLPLTSCAHNVCILVMQSSFIESI